MSEIKCPVCGCKELVESDFPMTPIEGWSSYRPGVYSKLCTNCGFVMTFDENKRNKINQAKIKRKELNDQIKPLEEKIASLEKEIQPIESAIKSLTKEKQDPNRTVARDQEISNELHRLDQELREIKSQISNYTGEIQKIRHTIDAIKG